MIELIWKDLVIPSVGVVTTALSAWLLVNWVNRDKSKATVEQIEVANDNVIINNLEKAVNLQTEIYNKEREFNKRVMEEHSKKFEQLTKTVADTNTKVAHLTTIVEKLLEVSCLNLSCAKRNLLSASQSQALIAGNNIDLKDGTKSKKNIQG